MSEYRYQEYPKSLYLRGWDDLNATVVVNNEDEEATARAEGYRSLAEPAETDPKAEPAKRDGR